MKDKSSRNISEESTSCWPLELLLDELTLSVRRQTIMALIAADLWPLDEIFQQTMQILRAQGEEVASYMLAPALGAQDAALLKTDVFAGFARNRFAVHLPSIASFGYEIGYGLMSPTTCQQARATEIASLCALFNIGITLFDLICDAVPHGTEVLSQAFHSQILQSLIDDPATAGSLRATTENMARPELRILMKIICAFFERLEALVPHGDGVERQQLGKLLGAAYAAQMASFSPSADPCAAEEKSRLPFFVMLQIVRVCAPADPFREHANAWVEALATAIWLVDDLADLAHDVQRGDQNALRCISAAPEDARAQVQRLLDGPIIKAAVTKLCEALLVIKSLSRSPAADEGKADFCAMVLSYIRDWIS